MALAEDLSVKYITNLVRDFKFKPFQAAAFPGNFWWESGGFTKLQEGNPIGGGRGGLGHMQSTGDRRVDFERWIARHAMLGWNAGTFEANYSQLFRELTGNAASDESRVVALVYAAATLEDATDIVCDKFERPNPNYAHKDKRREHARQALAAFEASGINVDELLRAPRPGTDTVEVLSPQPTGQQTAPQVDLQALFTTLGPLLLPLVQQFLASGQLALPSPTPTPKAPEPTVVVTPPAKPTISPSMGLGLTGILGSLAAMSVDPPLLGTPLGMGQNPTAAGNIVPLLFAAIPAIASFFGPVGSAIGRVISVAGPAIMNRQPPK